jgi:hypothetical protein
MLRPWPASTTPSLAVLSLLLACSTAGTEQLTDTSSGSGGEDTNLTSTTDPSDTASLPTTTSDPTTLTDSGTFTTGNDPSTSSNTASDTSTGPTSESSTEPETGSTGTTSGTTIDDTTGSTGDTSTGTTDGSSSSSTGDPPEGCVDGEKNGDETDVDCGGSCSGCALDQTCAVDGDCESLSCEAEICVEASCDDSKLNGDETDIDCGGSCDADCLEGDSCKVAEDCDSGSCAGDICQPPACNDNVLNGDETDTDCGGSCDGCASGGICLIDADCADGICENDVCAEASCDDNIANGGEAGIDCGGPTCAPCELVINEVDYDQLQTDTAEFIEILNKEPNPVNLADIRVVLVNGSNSTSYTTINLAPAGTLAPGQYLLIAPPNFVAPDGVLKVNFAGADNQIQNGAPDGLALIDLTNKKLIDALSYEGAINAATVTGLDGMVSLVEGMALPVAVADVDAVVGSLSRLPDGTDTNNAATDWVASKNPTPGVANVP